MFYFVYFFLLFTTSLKAQKNMVIVLMDDLDVVLDGMIPLSNTVELIGEKGANYVNSFAASPICCPNRATLLTGKYMHNHHAFNNSIKGNCSSPSWQINFEKDTFASHLQRKKNYRTFYAGKYLNQYGSRKAGGALHIPKGWSWWNGLIGNSRYYNYSLSVNGSERKYGAEPGDYLTDVISGLAVDFLKIQSKEAPFLMMLAPPAPHAPFTPANRHRDKYKGTRAKRTKNFNNFPNKDKHWMLRTGSPLSKETVSLLDDSTKFIIYTIHGMRDLSRIMRGIIVYRKRWETLLSVDQMVLKIYKTLKKKNMLDDTFIIFTSDNGYHIGQFGLAIDKRQLYETDIRVPLLIRGPGISPGSIVAPVSSVDLFPTILYIAGINFPSDGTSLLKSLSKDRTVLVEYRGEKSTGLTKSGCPSDYDINVSHCDSDLACKCEDAANNTFTCIRRVSDDFDDVFCSFRDDQDYLEAYDLKQDKEQMNNIAYTMKKRQRNMFQKQLKKMARCENRSCVRTKKNQKKSSRKRFFDS